MKKTLFLLLLTVKLSHGRIGETLDECTSRYGPMLKLENATGKFYSDYPQHCFTFENILIRIRFYKGRSAQEEFYGSAMTEKREEILASNGEKATGVKVVVVEEGRRLTITTQEFDQLMKKELGSGF